MMQNIPLALQHAFAALRVQFQSSGAATAAAAFGVAWILGAILVRFVVVNDMNCRSNGCSYSNIAIRTLSSLGAIATASISICSLLLLLLQNGRNGLTIVPFKRAIFHVLVPTILQVVLRHGADANCVGGCKAHLLLWLLLLVFHWQ